MKQSGSLGEKQLKIRYKDMKQFGSLGEKQLKSPVQRHEAVWVTGRETAEESSTKT